MIWLRKCVLFGLFHAKFCYFEFFICNFPQRFSSNHFNFVIFKQIDINVLIHVVCFKLNIIIPKGIILGKVNYSLILANFLNLQTQI